MIFALRDRRLATWPPCHLTAIKKPCRKKFKNPNVKHEGLAVFMALLTPFGHGARAQVKPVLQLFRAEAYCLRCVKIPCSVIFNIELPALALSLPDT